MKNTIILILVFASFGFSLVLNAQNDEFSVFSKKGEVQVQKGGKGAYMSLKVGEKVLSKDKIILTSGTMITLYNAKYKKSIELKKPGTYNASAIVSDMQKKKGYNDKFKDYVFSEMTASNNLFSSGKDENMNTMGSVDRQINLGGTESRLESLAGTDKDVSFAVAALADELAESNTNLIQAKLPRSSYVADDDVEFSWYERKGSSLYEFRIVDNTDKVIFSKKIHNCFLNVNLNDAKIEKGKIYYWYVVDGDNKSNQYSICRLTDSDSESLDILLKDINYDEMSPLEKMNLANYYEDRNIMNRAVKVYENVLKDYPDSQDLKKLYSRYLVRIGLFSEATNLLKN